MFKIMRKIRTIRVSGVDVNSPLCIEHLGLIRHRKQSSICQDRKTKRDSAIVQREFFIRRILNKD